MHAHGARHVARTLCGRAYGDTPKLCVQARGKGGVQLQGLFALNLECCVGRTY